VRDRCKFAPTPDLLQEIALLVAGLDKAHLLGRVLPAQCECVLGRSVHHMLRITNVPC
jgi:hypothetical protein